MHLATVIRDSIKYRTDGKLFNLHRIHAFTEVKETGLRNLLLNDDCMLSAGSEWEMQGNKDKFSATCNNLGLTVSTKKTEVMHQPAPGQPYVHPSVTIKGQKLPAINKFKYLGSILSMAVLIDDKVNCRIAKASASIRGLCYTAWEWRGISLKMKLKVYSSIVMPTQLYACEIWNCTGGMHGNWTSSTCHVCDIS